ncbi:MAG: TIGR04013 family B12-binding domain/radical SAM domain-containing protein [Methanocorpusculum sp.]|nr:TIGR04013 family B12-binding domain/radical SAM domain-containing protein [Methanocorpusculum sp.]
MNIVWRYISQSRNTCAVLYAACEKYSYTLEPVDEPAGDIICYSLNSLDYGMYADEIRNAAGTTIVGGPHPSACWQDVVRDADYVVVGEGERTLPRLLDALTDPQSGTIPSEIPGVATEEHGLTPIDHSVRLDAFPCFTRLKGYIELSRGCPFNCGYCQTPCLHGRHMRHRSREAVVEMAHKYHDVRFVTPNAFAYGSADGKTPAPEKLERLLGSMPDNDVYLGTFPSEVRPEFVNPVTAGLVAEFCANKNLHFGAQSGSDEVLKKLHRGHTSDDVRNALDVCRETGLMPVVDVIFGFPFETDEDEEKTLVLVGEIARFGRVHVHYLTPLPGTPLAGAVCRKILPDVDKKLGKLALNGRVTGYWHDKTFSSS